jgi:hypothetical protein
LPCRYFVVMIGHSRNLISSFLPRQVAARCAGCSSSLSTGNVIVFKQYLACFFVAEGPLIYLLRGWSRAIFFRITKIVDRRHGRYRLVGITAILPHTVV